MGELTIRDATEDDVAALTDIQNALLDTSTIEWRDEHHTVADRTRWLAAKRADGHPVLVADADGDVIGFATYGAFRDNAKWPGYRLTVEHTVHVAASHWGTGVGRMLVEALLDRARAAGVHVVVAAVDGSNDGSVRFHERLGFIQVARMPQVGTKHGRWLDLVLLQLQLDDAPPPPR